MNQQVNLFISVLQPLIQKLDQMEALTLDSLVQNQIQVNQSNITTATGTTGIIREVQIVMGII